MHIYMCGVGSFIYKCPYVCRYVEISPLGNGSIFIFHLLLNGLSIEYTNVP